MFDECPCVAGLTGIFEDVPVTVTEVILLVAELLSCAGLTGIFEDLSGTVGGVNKTLDELPFVAGVTKTDELSCFGGLIGSFEDVPVTST